jgi:sec-independent protein translocase protein TatC
MATRAPVASSEDYFADTRMSFGDHLEDLRTHLWRAIVGFMICLFIGFVLDGVGYATGVEWIGLGRPMLHVIAQPVTDQLDEFYDRRMRKVMAELDRDEMSLGAMNLPSDFLQIGFSRQQLEAVLKGKPTTEINQQPKPAEDADLVLMWTRLQQPARVAASLQKAERYLGKRPGLTTLSITEAFFVYFKVSMLCGVVISSPWVFWQIWSFIAAGLYPQEKRLVNVYLPFSLGLFLGGILVCQFLVMPRAIGALLWFNEWLDLEPDLRLNEWLGFAILMPLVFGVSFQTPLVMFMLERIGVLTVETMREKRKFAVFLMAVFVAIVTPTPDALSMMFLWIPMCGLYELGIILCQLIPKPQFLDFDADDEGVEV